MIPSSAIIMLAAHLIQSCLFVTALAPDLADALEAVDGLDDEFILALALLYHEMLGAESNHAALVQHLQNVTGRIAPQPRRKTASSKRRRDEPTGATSMTADSTSAAASASVAPVMASLLASTYV